MLRFQIKSSRVLVKILFGIILVYSVRSNGEKDFFPNDENCGMTEEIEGDDRTFNPWNIAIFMRKNIKSPFKYFLTGTLASGNTVITGFGGSYGQPPYINQNKNYFVPPVNRFLIVAGLNSTSLLDADEHTQFANVSYIAPHPGNSTNFHFAIFRLKRKLNLKGRYVRSVCQPFALLPHFHSVGYVGRYQDFLQFTGFPTLIGGFNNSPKIKKPFPNIAVVVKGSINEACVRSYKYHYKTEPAGGIFCVRGVASGNTSTCVTHGSSLVWKTSQFEISFIPALGPFPRYFFVGTFALIPRRDLQECDEKTLYYVVIVWDVIDFLKDHMLCDDPETFPCSSGVCIPLYQVCDGKEDCAGGQDEEPIYCAATSRCRDPNDYQCGYEGKCIRFDEVDDGKPDCPEGNDEDDKLAEAKRFGRKIQTHENITCPPLQQSEGVTVECRHSKYPDVSCSNAPIGTKARLRCARFYSSLQKLNFASMKCFEGGHWKPNRAFLCQTECGVIGTEVNQHYVANGIGVQTEEGFPWHAAIFKASGEGSGLKYICGGSLIERNVVITAAHCVTNDNGLASDVTKFRIVLGSLSTKTIIIENNHMDHIFEVDKMWRPYSYNHETRQSDIAVLKLNKPVTYSPTIRPVCYLTKSFSNLPSTNSIGTIPGFGVTETGRISEGLNYANLRVLPLDDCALKFHDKFCARSKKERQTICYGDSGGGLVFPTKEGHKTSSKFILKGIASDLQQPKGIRCDVEPNGTSVFTHLDSHREWLLTTLEEIDVNPDL